MSVNGPALYFVHQDIYMRPARLRIAHFEDCRSQLSVAAEYRHKVAANIKLQCSLDMSAQRKNLQTSNSFKNFPTVALDNIIIDKERKFFYSRVLGAFGAKWSSLMVALNKADGGDDNLLKLSTLFSTPKGEEYLNSNPELFKFYFVRNPLDRVISGYYYYFQNLDFAKRYLKGVPLKELVTLNQLNLEALTSITFEQYIRWIVHGNTSALHFGVQSDIIQPCQVTYDVNGIFEIIHRDRYLVSNQVLDLKTREEEFTTQRDLVYLTQEARNLVKSVQDSRVMDEFYEKYQEDYRFWNYSKPEDSWYPFPGILRRNRKPSSLNKVKNDWPKLGDLAKEETRLEGAARGTKSSSAQGSVSIVLLTLTQFYSL